MEKKKNYTHKLSPRDEMNTNKSVVRIEAVWCGACHSTRTNYEKTARINIKKGSNIVFYRVDYDEFLKERKLPRLIRKMLKGAKSLPTFYFIEDGEIVAKVSGYNSAEIDRILKNMNE